MLIMDETGLKEEDRVVVEPARARAKRLKEEDGVENPSAMALELQDGTIVTGKYSALMDAGAAVLLNAVKYIARIQGDLHLISPVVLEPIKTLKYDLTGNPNPALNAKEVLIALSISAAMNPIAGVALEKLKMLHGCQAHSTTMLNDEDERALRNRESTSPPTRSSRQAICSMTCKQSNNYFALIRTPCKLCSKISPAFSDCSGLVVQKKFQKTVRFLDGIGPQNLIDLSWFFE